MLTFKQFLDVKLNRAANDMTLTEAAFSSADKVKKVNDIYGSLFGKIFGGAFKTFSVEDFQRSTGEKGHGYRLMNSRGYQLRFNYSVGNTKVMSLKFSKNSFVLDSIDFWDVGNTDFEKPSLTVSFDMSTNVMQIWKKLGKLLKAGKVGTFNIGQLSEAANFSDGTNRSQRIKFKQDNPEAKKFFKGVDYNDEDSYNKAIDSAGLRDQYDEYVLTIAKGKAEKNSFGDKIRGSKKQLETTVYADPDVVFDDIEKLTRFVANGGSRSLIVCGMGGIGKTYGITKELTNVLGEEGVNWYYSSGDKTSPRAFYATVFANRNKLICFDEADSALKNDDIVMMLKPALDTSGKNTMQYSVMTHPIQDNSEMEDYARYLDRRMWAGESIVYGNKDTEENPRYPSKFKFTGQMIFISNMRAKEIEGAILSRSLFIDVYLCAKDVNNRIRSIMYKKYSTMPKEEIDALLMELNFTVPETDEEVTYMTPELARKVKPVTMRTAEIAMSLKLAGFPDASRLAAMYA